MSKISTRLKKKNIIISEQNNPLWERIFATIFYVLAFCWFFMYTFSLIYTLNHEFTWGYITIGAIVFLISEGILLFSAFQLSAIDVIYFDLDNNKYKKVIDIGFVKLGFWKKLPFIEYISIEYHYGTYEAHLKFLDEQCQIIFIADTYADIFSITYDTAKQIHVGMHDAIRLNAKYWVDLTKSKNELLAAIGLYTEPIVCTLPKDKGFRKKNSKTTTVSEGQKSITMRVLSAFVFTLGIVYFVAGVLYITSIYTNDYSYILNVFSEGILITLMYLLVPSFLAIIYLKNWIAVVRVQHDTKHNIYRTVYDYGWIKHNKKWKCLPKIEYVSMYYNGIEKTYNVVVFKFNNKSINMFNGNNLGETFRLAYETAIALNVKLLNATDWDNQYWVDLSQPQDILFTELVAKNR